MRRFNDLQSLLRRIDAGEVRLDEGEQKAARDGMHTIVTFHVRGWVLDVFNDGGDFDYIDRAVSPGGDVLTFDDLWDNVPYRPKFSWW